MRSSLYGMAPFPASYRAYPQDLPYREALRYAQPKLLICNERGTQFDPDIVDGFLRAEPHFIASKERFSDAEKHAAATALPAASPIPQLTRDSTILGQQSKVLVVDDNELIRDLVANFLRSRGIDCVLANDVVEALELFDQYHPKLIISDWSMARVDGLELCRRVRARTGGTHVHFIMLTAHADEEELAAHLMQLWTNSLQSRSMQRPC